jgi:hypothetical protein
MRIISVLGLKSMPLVQFLAATAIVSWIESGTHRPGLSTVAPT